MKKSILFFIILSSLVILACGGAGRYLFYNKDYVLEKQDQYSIAIFPPPDSISFYWCETLTETFKYKNDRLNIVPCGALYDKLREYDDLKILLSKAVKTTYPDTEITYTPNLHEKLTDDELLMLHSFLNEADFLIVPFCDPILGDRRGIIYSATFLRMFDLKNGELLFDKSIMIPLKKKEADLDLVLGTLAAASYAQFDSLFWRPFVLDEKDSTTTLGQ
ncbi:MAG: hypothetical protein JSU85_14005 [Candidatus Zixiibacteriota bacterium]|nr:MAG: hypothetical protein JSU85_14005 [candidate division Zixibacteria bacterium]